MKTKVYEVMEKLILHNNVDTFLMDSKSDFDRLCREVVSDLKVKFPNIKGVYVRAEYPYINDDYEKYLLGNCEETYYPESARNAGKSVYIKRNCEMIDKSKYCIIYFKDEYLPPTRKKSKQDAVDYQPKSGTGIAYHYAVRKKNNYQCRGISMLIKRLGYLRYPSLF